MEDKTYDCLTCPSPRHKTPELIFCDVCIRRILEEHDARKAVSKEKSSIAWIRMCSFLRFWSTGREKSRR